MKRVLYSISLIIVLSLTLIGCSKEESSLLEVPSGSIIVHREGDSGVTTFDSRNLTSLTPTSVPNGWSVDNIDMYKGTITVTSPSSFENDEVRSGQLHLKGYTPTGRTRGISIYLAIAPEINLVDAKANCFVATEPNTLYRFDPMTGGSSTPLQTVELKLLWQTSSGLIKYLDMRDGGASFFIEEDKDNEGKVKPGNALIAAYDANGEIVWSWHVWVTNNAPEDDVVTLNGITMMNKNLGAEINSNGSTDGSVIYQSYGMYYQWGRKEPFVGPLAYNFPSNDDAMIVDTDGYRLALKYVDSTAEQGSVQWAIANPMALIKGNKDNDYNWLYEGADDELWSASTKSEYDPCPAGWRMPANALFDNLTIKEAADAQKQYGWTLVDAENNEYFFTAQGRRNYLDCRLDIFNDDATLPVPWSGYYWSATTDAAEAKALYFDIATSPEDVNALNTSRPMHRANAMPVRCVKE